MYCSENSAEMKRLEILKTQRKVKSARNVTDHIYEYMYYIYEKIFLWLRMKLVGKYKLI